MAICHFDSHGKRHQSNKLFFFLNFRDSQTWRFSIYPCTYVLFISARVSWECTSSKSNPSQLPSPRLKTSIRKQQTGHQAAAKQKRVKSQGIPTGTGLQPMNTKHGEATGTHKPGTTISIVIHPNRINTDVRRHNIQTWM